MTRLAIDLGTSHTVAVVERPGQQPRPLLFDGSPVLPSGVFAAAGGIHVGRDAERLSQLEPHRYEPHPKRRIDEGTVLLGDSEYPVATLLGALLHRVLQEAGPAGSTTVVLTCPADWGRVRRSVLIDAAHQAGITDPVLVDEPVAAAAYCTRVLGGHVPAGQSLLVFDFGGGTLDLALVRLDPSGTPVTGVSGLENLGGLDVDEALVGHLGQIVAARDPATWERLSRPRGPAELRDRRTFRAEVRVAKEMLSRTTAAPVSVPGLTDTLHLTREELDRLAGPLVDRAVDETRRLLDRVGQPVSGILLVGGSSRIPLVATRLHGRFGIAPMVPEQPELPVALGALASLDEAASAAPTSGSAAPVSGDPRHPRPPGPVLPGPVSGAPGFGAPGYGAQGPAAPISGMPGTPVSGGYLSGENTNTGIPISGDPGAPWTGRPPATAWDAPPPRRTRRRGSPRGATIIAIAASVMLVVLAGATIWFVRDALGDPDGRAGSGDGSAAGASPSGGASASSAPALGPAPSGFAWCEKPEQAIFCPTTPMCEDADSEEVDCSQPHSTELFVGGILPAQGFAGSDQLDKSPEVKAGCSASNLNARAVDRDKIAGWNRYAQWQWRNGVNLFLCFTGPEEGTTTGSAIKTA